MCLNEHNMLKSIILNLILRNYKWCPSGFCTRTPFIYVNISDASQLFNLISIADDTVLSSQMCCFGDATDNAIIYRKHI